MRGGSQFTNCSFQRKEKIQMRSRSSRSLYDKNINGPLSIFLSLAVIYFHNFNPISAFPLCLCFYFPPAFLPPWNILAWISGVILRVSYLLEKEKKKTESWKSKVSGVLKTERGNKKKKSNITWRWERGGGSSSQSMCLLKNKFRISGPGFMSVPLLIVRRDGGLLSWISNQKRWGPADEGREKVL